MKTSIKGLLAVCLLLSTITTYAQVQVNPRVGVNVSAVDANLQDFRAEARAGWHAGLDFRVGDGFLYLNPGLAYYNYSARLMENLEENRDVNFSEETTIRSLKAPLNIGMRIFGLHAKGGIVPTYVMGVKEAENFDFDIDQLNRLTWGAQFGVGIDLLFLTAEVMYEKGLTDYFDGVEGGNNVLSLSVGLKF